MVEHAYLATWVKSLTTPQLDASACLYFRIFNGVIVLVVVNVPIDNIYDDFINLDIYLLSLLDMFYRDRLYLHMCIKVSVSSCITI